MVSFVRRVGIVAYTVFISYAHEDKPFLAGLLKHLSILLKQGLISKWSDSDILPGTEWRSQIMKHVRTDQIVLLLISADFIASDFCYSIEMNEALKRHEAGEARVIPILVRPTIWQDAPFAELQILPSDARAISTWSDRDSAYIDVVAGIKRVVQDLQASTNANSNTQSKAENLSSAQSSYTQNLPDKSTGGDTNPNPR